MKNILIASILLVMFSTNNIQAQNQEPIQISFSVQGVCDMCKSRIENAALIKGVKFAEWIKEAQTLTVVYKPAKVDEMTIHEAVAQAGHDTSMVKAEKQAYKKLPGCCAYRDGVKVH